MSDVQRIRKFVIPPAEPVATGASGDFQAVESSIGLSLPEDYKSLITTYGDGQWQEFWYLLNPFSRNPQLNLLAQASRDDNSGGSLLSAERSIRDRHDYPHAIWPETGGVFPWAVTDNGGRFFWLTAGPPATWASVYHPSRDPDYQELLLSTSQIVAGLLSGELPLFEQEFGGATPPATFTPFALSA